MAEPAPHGTRRRYTQGCFDGPDGTPCPPCRAANAEYQRNYRRARSRPLYVAPDPTVPAGQLRAHIAELRDAGVGAAQIAFRARITESAVWRLVSGETSRVTPDVRDRVMAVAPSDGAPGSRVDGSNARERLEALTDLGWTLYRVASTTGLPYTTVKSVPKGKTVTRAVDDAIAELYHRELGVHEIDDRDPLAVWVMLLSDIGDQTWRRDAECRRLEGELRDRVNLFFPSRGGDVDTPREVCDACPVSEQCLDFALTTNAYMGIWGGTSGDDRRALRQDMVRGDDELAS